MVWPGPFDGGCIRRAGLALWLAAGAAAGAGPEPVLARVLTVAPDRVTLAIEGAGRSAEPPVEIALGADGLPAGVTTGSLVRLWPGPAGFTTGARLVPLEQGMAGQDRTGVRARLMHGAGRGFGGGRGGR